MPVRCSRAEFITDFLELHQGLDNVAGLPIGIFLFIPFACVNLYIIQSFYLQINSRGLYQDGPIVCIRHQCLNLGGSNCCDSRRSIAHRANEKLGKGHNAVPYCLCSYVSQRLHGWPLTSSGPTKTMKKPSGD